MAKPGAIRGQKKRGGAVVSKSVPILKELVPPPHPQQGTRGTGKTGKMAQKGTQGKHREICKLKL